jgi:hypothetical protein
MIVGGGATHSLKTIASRLWGRGWGEKRGSVTGFVTMNGQYAADARISLKILKW